MEHAAHIRLARKIDYKRYTETGELWPGGIRTAHYSGGCTEPRKVESFTRPYWLPRSPRRSGSERRGIYSGTKELIVSSVTRGKPVHTLLSVRCRKCQNCRRAKRAMWAAAAEREIAKSVRTWFVTLTLSPEFEYVALLRAEHRLMSQGRTVPADNAERDGLVLREAQREVTKWLKRVRQKTQGRLRYILAAERGKSGTRRLHFHLLVHECDADRPTNERMLRSYWRSYREGLPPRTRLGFAHARLVSRETDVQISRAAHYVCKYITKGDVQPRLRASQHYGDVPECSCYSPSEPATVGAGSEFKPPQAARSRTPSERRPACARRGTTSPRGGLGVRPP